MSCDLSWPASCPILHLGWGKLELLLVELPLLLELVLVELVLLLELVLVYPSSPGQCPIRGHAIEGRAALTNQETHDLIPNSSGTTPYHAFQVGSWCCFSFWWFWRIWWLAAQPQSWIWTF